MTQDSDKFIGYPSGYLFGVVDDPDQATALVDELRQTGLGDVDLMRFTGEEGAARIDASGAGHGLVARLVRLLESTDDSRIHATQYEAEARAGHCVIGVHAPAAEEKAQCRQLLKARGAHFINYYSQHGMTETLDP